MIHTKTGPGRRILTFPSVQPCKSVSIVTLLNSLIQLGDDILSFKPKHLSTNKRSFQETLRHIQNLVLIFEEIRTRVLTPKRYFPYSTAVSSLSNIHVILQKLKFLVEDCTRDGARLYILMNSNQVSDHLHVLITSISTSLSTFPSSSVDLPNEVNELIDLVVGQTRKYNVLSDQNDKLVITSVYRILSLFENSVVPDPDEIIRILDHVGIRKRRDCIKEVNFLEQELATKKNVELLSSLMGFISYSRCVVLRQTERNDHDHGNVKEQDLLQGLKDEDLLCPISLEIMNDPVVIQTGHTYDRTSITKWLASGNITCPKTGKILTTTDLIDNVTVKQVIHKHCKTNGHRQRKKTHYDDVITPSASRLIAKFLALELTNNDKETIHTALREIRVLTKTSSFNRSCLIESGVVTHLLKFLTSKDSNIQENAMAAILNLSKHVTGRSKIVEEDGLRIIADVLNEGVKTETRLYSASALFYLSSVDEYNILIGENANAVSGLMNIIKGDYSDSTKRTVLVTVMSLLTGSDNHWRVLAAGAVPVLLDLLRTEEVNGELTADCLATLAKLTEFPDGTICVIRRGGLKLAVRVLSSLDVSLAVKRNCVGLVFNLCVNGGLDVVGVLVKDSVVMGSLYTVLSNGGGKKASALIRMIHEFQERKTGLVEPEFQRGRFVSAW